MIFLIVHNDSYSKTVPALAIAILPRIIRFFLSNKRKLI